MPDPVIAALVDALQRALSDRALVCNFHAQADDPEGCCCGKPKAYHWKPVALAAIAKALQIPA